MSNLSGKIGIAFLVMMLPLIFTSAVSAADPYGCCEYPGACITGEMEKAFCVDLGGTFHVGTDWTCCEKTKKCYQKGEMKTGCCEYEGACIAGSMDVKWCTDCLGGAFHEGKDWTCCEKTKKCYQKGEMKTGCCEYPEACIAGPMDVKWCTDCLGGTFHVGAEWSCSKETKKCYQGKILPVTPQWQNKDTKMLCLEGCNLTGESSWDNPHADGTIQKVFEHEKNYCVRACISMINSYYQEGHIKKLSQDYISYHYFKDEAWNGYGADEPEGDLGHGQPIYVSHTKDVVGGLLSWALGGVRIEKDYSTNPHVTVRLTYAKIKEKIDAGHPFLYVELYDGGYHAWVLRGYEVKQEGDKWEVHVTVNNPLPKYNGLSYKLLLYNGSKPGLDDDYIDIHGWWVANEAVKNPVKDPENISIDTDGDGIVDFDEEMRFKTDVNNNDTDNDCLPDKLEIQSYTFIYDSSLGKFVFDKKDIRKPDVDKDKKRAENDSDTDNGGVTDGVEDENANGKVDIGETDPFNKDDDKDLKLTLLSPSHQEVLPGKTAIYKIEVNVTNANTEIVNLEYKIIEQTGGWDVSLDPTTVIVPSAKITKLTVTSSLSNEPCNYIKINVTGTLQNGAISCLETDTVTTDTHTIPEFTTIAIPVVATIGLLFLFSRRRKKEE